ncbi:MAG: MFS transporter [Verrucomicrobiae bacterium]|nr:MFS transporter [Verrucomicrobiae bacterium]
MNKRLFALYSLIFIDALGVAIIYPLMPKLFLDPVQGLIQADEIFLSRDILYGMAFAAFPLLSFFGMPILGGLSDFYGRRKLILAGLAGIVAGYFLGAWSIVIGSYLLFLSARAVSGFCCGTLVIANAVISDISADTRSKLSNFKWPVIANIAGFILGPAISSGIHLIPFPFPLALPFFLAAFLSLVNGVMLFFVFAETAPCVLNDQTASPWRNIFASITYLLRSTALKKLNLGYSFFYFGFGLFLQSISLYLAHVFGYSPSDIGVFFIFVALSLGVSVFFLQPGALKHFDYRKLILFSLLAQGLLFLFLFVSDLRRGSLLPFELWTVALLFFLALPFVQLGLTTLYSNIAKPGEQGVVMGGLGQIYSLMWFASALILGQLMAASRGLIFLVAGLTILSGYAVIRSAMKNLASIPNPDKPEP